jgi:benzoyl-CoA reductase subunit C
VTHNGHRAKVGYFCSYVPKEIIYAFDRVPVRVLPTAAKASAAEAYLPRNFCSLVKTTLASFLEDESDLEAVVHADSCDALRRFHDVWRHYVDIEALHLLDLPRINTPTGQEYFRRALRQLAEELEQRYHLRLTPQRLEAAIECYNQQRSLLQELDTAWVEGRIPSVDYYRDCTAAMTEDPRLVNPQLRERLDDIARHGAPVRHDTSILVVGSLLVRPDLVEAIENQGARVVADDSCSIGRVVTGQIPVSHDLDGMLTNIALAYLGKSPCPRMRDFPTRLEHLSQLIASHGVQGVICSYYKFCDLFMSEYPVLRKAMQDRGIPVLLLEDEGEAILSGQHRTRLEAFLELLQ